MTSQIVSDVEGPSGFITGADAGIGAVLAEGFVAYGAKIAPLLRSDAVASAAELGHGYSPAAPAARGNVGREAVAGTVST